MERYPVFIVRRFNSVEMSIIPKAIYRPNVISIKISMALFFSFRKIQSKIPMESEGIQNRKIILKRTKLEDSNILISKHITKP